MGRSCWDLGPHEKRNCLGWIMCRNTLLCTLVVVNLAGIMERADEALLPGVYREVGLSLHASPTRLGSLTLLRSIVQMLCFPLAAFMSQHHNRANVIALGAILWAAATFCVGISTSFLEVAISRALNGIGLAMVIPAIQSMVADATEEGNRGLAFGWLQFTGNLGGIIGNVLSVLLAGTTVLGVAGWRASFHLIAILSVLVALLVYKYAVDPRFTEPTISSDLVQKSGRGNRTLLALKETLQEAQRVVRVPTFIAIVAQGVAGTFPWAALSFAPMWLELIGFSHTVTATIIGLFTASGSLGGLFGGRLGDLIAKRLPNSGRIILAQFSSGIGIPLGAVLLLYLPYDPSTAVLHGSVFFIMGFLMSWCATATNNPIFAEIVPEKSRTSVYALDRSFESVLSSFAPPLVGILAEHVFGYVTSSTSTTHDGGTAVVADKRNAAALAKALYTAFGIPYTLCCLIYSLLYWTYPRDRDRARAEMVAQMELSSSVSEFYNLKQPGYVSLKEDTERGTTQEEVSDPLSVEKQHILADVS